MFWINVLLKILLIIITTLLFLRFVWLAKSSLDPYADASFYWLRAYIILVLLSAVLFGILFLFNISIATALRIAVWVMSGIWAMYATIATIKWKDIDFLVIYMILLLIPAAVLFFL